MPDTVLLRFQLWWRVEPIWINIWFLLYIRSPDNIWKLNWPHTCTYTPAHTQPFHAALYFQFGHFICITKSHRPMAPPRALPKYGHLHPSLLTPTGSLLLYSQLCRGQLIFLLATIRTVSAATRALCPMLLWRKGASDASSLCRVFLSLTSCSLV